MAKAYQPFTIEKFAGLRFTDVLNNAALEDAEGAVVDNFNISDLGTLKKRLGFVARNLNIVPTIKSPAGVAAFTAPLSIRLLAIQRRSPTGVNPSRIWFTDVNQSNVWCADLPNLTNVTIVQVPPAPAAFTGAEWMIQAATPAFPYQMQVCRSNGAMVGIDQNALMTTLTSSPAGTHMTLFKDRLFMINSVHPSGQESRLNFSDVATAGGYGVWPANNFIDINPASGEFNVATIVFNDTLIIFKNHSTWVLTADGQPTSWIVRNLHPTIGCIGRGTPIIISGFIYFLSQDGVYRTDGTTFERISEPVDSYIQGFGTVNSATVLIRDAYYWDDKYILMLPATTGVNATPLVYDTRENVWTRWVLGGTPQLDLYGGQVYNDITPTRLYAGSRLHPEVYSMGDPAYTDNGGDYSAIWQSKRFTWADPTKYKRNYMFLADVGYATTEPENVIVTHSIDNTQTVQPRGPGVVGTTAVSMWDLSRKELKFAGAGYTRTLSTKISYLGDQKFDLFKVTWLNSTGDVVKTSN